MILQRLALATLAAAPLSCGGGMTFVGPPVVQVGTGAVAYQPIDTTPLPIIHGIQGGYHVWGGAIAGNCSSEVDLHFLLLDSGGGVAAEAKLPHSTLETVDLQLEYWGAKVILSDPASAHGRTFRLDVQLTRSDGAVCEDSRIVVLQ